MAIQPQKNLKKICKETSLSPVLLESAASRFSNHLESHQ